MYALPCSCGHTLAVSPGQAGDQISCPECGRAVSIPLLRELRQLPRVARDEDPVVRPAGSFALRLLFGLAGFVALAAAGWASFALLSAMAVEIQTTTDQHVASQKEILLRSSPAELVAYWDEMARAPMAERHPFAYQEDQFKKEHWQRLATIGYSIAAVAVIVAIALAAFDRRRTPLRAG
ncbi:hypothetical protein [Roseimaritima sediminicola]|uniref:hypothetical protein n=1 Tax=Roseimaritima sediminicola TaxID=2662066 RepID=UPI0012983DD8|nr:hypothetical protein [Roseimaritima sediminicola]